MSLLSCSNSSNTGSHSDEGGQMAQQILGKKVFKKKIYYKVKWFGNDTPTWELEKNCQCQHLIDQYESNAMNVYDDEEEDQWEVEEILDKRTRKDGKQEYLVKWRGWPGEPTWELDENCECINLIAAFENPKLKQLWAFDGSNRRLWLDRRSVLRYMRRYIRDNNSPVNLLRFLPDNPESEREFELQPGINIGPLCYINHWYLVIILVEHINTTKKILVGDSLNTLIGVNKKTHPVIRRLKKVYPKFHIQPIAMTQMERSDVCAYYILAAFERAIFLFRQDAAYIVDSILFDPIRAEIIRNEIRPDTNGEISVALPIPEAFDDQFVCEFCRDLFESRKMVDKHILAKHFKDNEIKID